MWSPSKGLLLGPSTGSGRTVLTPPSVRGELVEPHSDWILCGRHILDGPHDGPRSSINPVRPGALPQKRPQRVTLSLSKGLPQVSRARKILLLLLKDQDDSFGARPRRGTGPRN